MNLKGKGIFLKNISDCRAGHVNQITDLVREANLSFIIIKIADGIEISNTDGSKDQYTLGELVASLRAQDISIWGWHHIYGQEPEKEASLAADRISHLSLDGYAVNADNEFQLPQSKTSASIFLNLLRQGIPNVPVALNSYKFPSIHPRFPWNVFLERCDYIIPQIFWFNAHHIASTQLQRSIKEYKSLAPFLPVFPCGPLIKKWGWVPYPDEIEEFMTTSQSLGLPGFCFYNLDNACSPLMEPLWKIFKDFSWQGQKKSLSFADRFIQALNSRDMNLVLSLYHEDASLMHGSNTSRGKRRFKKFFEKLFERVNLSDKFVLVNSIEIEDCTLNIQWQLVSENPENSMFSNDVIKLDSDKIITHYSITNPDPMK